MKRFLKSFSLLLCSSFLVATTGWAAEVMKLSFSRTTSSLGDEMQVTVTEGGDVQESATWTAIETNSKRSSANTEESTNFFNAVTGNFAPVSAGYPMVRSQFKLANDDNYWEMWIPVTLTREIAFDAILPEVYAVTAGAGAQQAEQKVFNFGFKIYRGEQSIGSTAETVLNVSGATDKLKDALYNTVGVNLDSPTRLSEGQYTFVLKLSANDCQGGSYSGIKGLSLIDYSTLSIADWSASFNGDNTTTGWITSWGDTDEQFDIFVNTPNGQGAKVTSDPKGHPWTGKKVSSPFSVAMYIDTSAIVINDKPAMLIGLGQTANHIALVKTAADTLEVYKSKEPVASLKISNLNLAFKNSYHLVAFGSNATESFLFVDGEKVTGEAIANPADGLQIGAMYCGLDTTTYTHGYNMIVDEVRGYNHLLTTPELNTLFKTFPTIPTTTVQPIEDVLAINFANDKANIGTSQDAADAVGFVKYMSDIAYDGCIVPALWNKTDAGKQTTNIDVKSSANNTYQLNWSSNDDTWTATDDGGVLTGGTLIERLTHGYLDNGGNSQNHIELTNLPTTGYDVAIIFSGDSSNRTGKNSRVTVNNRTYTYNVEGKLVEGNADWGVRFRSKSLTEGENVMFIPQRVDSELTIDTYFGDGRGTIAAVQVFLHKGAIIPVLSMDADTDKSGALSWNEIVAVVGGRTEWKISGAVTISLDADVSPALTALTLNPVNASGDKLTVIGAGSLYGDTFALTTAISVDITNQKNNPTITLSGTGNVTIRKGQYGIAPVANDYTGTFTVDDGQQITRMGGDLTIPFTVGANGAKLHSNDANWAVTSKISGSGTLTIESPSHTISFTSDTTEFSGNVEILSGTLYLDKGMGSVGNVFNNANTTLTVKSGAIFKTHLTQNDTSNYSRGLILEPGAQVINHDGHMNYNGDLVVNNGGDANSTSTYQLDYNKTADFKGVISGQGTLNLTVGNTAYSPHTVKISNENNTFSGTYHINPNNGNYTQLILEANGKMDDASVKMSKGQFKLMRDTSIMSLTGTAGTVTSNDSTVRTLTLNGDSDVRNLTFTNVNLAIASGETFITSITKATVGSGAKVKVILTADQKLNGLELTNVTVDEGGTVVFLDADGTTVLQESNSLEYAAAQECVYDVASGSWNKIPANDDMIVLNFEGTDTVTTVGDTVLPEGVTRFVKLTIRGANASVTAGFLNACTDAVVLENALSIVGTEEETTITGVISGDGQVKIAAGKVKFTKTNTYMGGTDIATGATLTITTSANAIGTTGYITGAGTLVCDSVRPANLNGLTTGVAASDEAPASCWTGTVHLKDCDAKDLKDFANQNSALTLEGVQGYFNTFTVNKLTLINSTTNGKNYGFLSNNGTSTASNFLTITVGSLEGTGTLSGTSWNKTPYYVYEIKDASKFEGVINTNTANGGMILVWIGENAPETSSDCSPYYGKIVIAGNATIAAGKTWESVNGITITENGTLTISEARALPTNKTVSGAGALVINGTVDLSGFTGALTCNLDVATGATVTITQAQAEAFASIEVNAGGSLKVIVAGKDIPYTANVTGEGSVNIILANGTVLSDTATYKPALAGDCTWLEFLFEGNADNQRLANGGTFVDEVIRGEDDGRWAFVDVGVTPARQALQIHDKYPWTSTAPEFSSLKTWSASFFAKMPKTEGGILMGFGTTVVKNGKNPGFIALVRGKGTDKVLLVSGTSSGQGYNILADFTVPNAESAYHLYTFVRTADGVNIYLDGEPWAPYGKTVTVGNGFQIGSLHGGYTGFTYSGELTAYSGLTLTRGGSATDTNGAVDMLRIYRFALSPEDVQTLASEYTYISPSGSYSREITVNAAWTADNAWTNDKNATTVSEPPKGSVTLTADAEEMLTMTVNASEAKAFEALTLQGTTIELIGAEGSKKLSVDGLTKVMCDATVDCGVIAMTGPVRVASNATLTLKVSEALLDSVVQNAVIGKYTYHLTGSAEGNVVIDNELETYNGWSVEIEQDDTKSWVLTMTRANWYVSIDADNVTTWRAGNTVETAVEVAAPEVSTNHPIYISVIGDASVTLPSGRTDNVTVSGSGRVTLNASANGTTIGVLTINDTAMAAITPALTVNQKTVTADATLGYAAANDVWTISSALPGSTKIEIVSGTVKVTAANGGYTGQITVAEGATLASGTGATCPFGKGKSAIVNYGTVILSAGQLPPTSGSGNVTINGSGGSGETSTKIAGPLTISGILSVSEGVTCALDRNGTDFSESPYVNGPSVQINGTVNVGTEVADGYITIAEGKTLSGSGTIKVPVTLADGATIDATAGAVTAKTVTLPAEGRVTVNAANYGDVLKKGGLAPMKFTVTGNSLNGQLIATADALVYAPVIDPVEGETAIADAVMAEVARAAGAEDVTTVTAVLPVTIVDENDEEILTVDVNGVELFNNVISFEDDDESGIENAKIAIVNYVFGISDITVNDEGKIVVKASVDCIVDNSVALIDGEEAGEGVEETPADPVKPTFVNGVTVELLNNGESIGTATVNVDNKSEITITSTNDLESILNPPAEQNEGEGGDESDGSVAPAPTSQTLDLTVKVTNQTLDAGEDGEGGEEEVMSAE